MTIQDIVLIGATFVLVAAVWIGGVVFWSMRRSTQRHRMEDRLQDTDDRLGVPRMLRLWHDGKEAVTSAPGLRKKMSLGQRIHLQFRLAGWSGRPGPILAGLLAGASLVALGAYAVTHLILPAVCAGAVTLLFCNAFMNRSIGKRSALFDRQFLDALELACRSLRAGHPLEGAFRLINQEIPAPVGEIFGEITQQQALGVPLADALNWAQERSGSSDMKLFSAAVAMQLRSGGSLAEMMQRLAEVIRDRMRLSRRIRVLTAQTQFSKRILVALPFVIFLVLNLIAPTYMLPLFETSTGRTLLYVAGAGLVTGIYLMNRIAQIRV